MTSSPSKRTCPLVASVRPRIVAPERGLAGARLADEPEHLAATDLEIDAVDRAHDSLLLAPQPPRDPLRHVEVRADVPHLDERAVAGGGAHVTASGLGSIRPANGEASYPEDGS